MNTIKVRSAPGTLCPREGKPRDYIIDAETGEDVPDSAYYRRLVADGSLVLVPAASPPAETAPRAETGIGEDPAPHRKNRQGGKS